MCWLCQGSSKGKFLFQIWASQQFVYICWCLLWCVLSAFRFQCGCHFHLWGICCMCWHTAALWNISLAGICACLVMVWGPHQACTRWLLFPLLWVEGSLTLLSSPPAIPAIWWGMQLWGLDQESPNTSAFPSLWGGIFFFRFSSTWWHGWLWISGGHETWWFQCGDWVSGVLVYLNGQWSILLLDNTCILGSWARCYH